MLGMEAIKLVMYTLGNQLFLYIKHSNTDILFQCNEQSYNYKDQY